MDTEQDKINRAVAEVRHNQIIEKLQSIVVLLDKLVVALTEKKGTDAKEN